MDGFDIAALAILILIVVIFILAFCVLAMLPGRVALSRNHQFATAIRVGGWATLIFGGVFWPLMLVWAFATDKKQNVGVPTSSDEEEAIP